MMVDLDSLELHRICMALAVYYSEIDRQGRKDESTVLLNLRDKMLKLYYEAELDRLSRWDK